MVQQRWIVGMLVFALAASPVLAIDLGDPAPALKIKEWVKGKPVDLKAGKGKNIYVVEFWATWCAPCRTSIPHLTEIQKKYKDKGVVVIAVTDEEKDAEKVKAYVKDQGDKMDYIVAIDDTEATNKGYMKAFNVRGIPNAFIVDKAGAIVWQGHPMEMDKPLEEIVAGTYDIEAAKKADAKARKAAEKAMKTFALMDEYFKLVSEGGEKDQEKAAKLGKKILKAASEDANLMNALAWKILDDSKVKHRDLKLAMKAAKAAYKESEGKSAAILDTYARALWDTGKKKKAIKYQKKAVKLCEDDQMKKELKDSLDRYKEELAVEDS